ncbi:hypothetical protein CC1G_04958 [Coprinopsis cinerea okayama7|uniref:NB-ARC domain-containing protein n=1 Tax=Coprinopsis cinerea (strain Okayama-7 / 130 / ATCC MYA-4618 / FGSC 9003) TaxID=240176 RepID=A8NSA5_COPC7|nr:hypothetical protein CC1G_04958 [Coprinopsis cinerea okayama7\|eukprot:XP_001835965.1 hypothetical protein CC1G_04958 [Coprinopsis cinerea okayama7\
MAPAEDASDFGCCGFFSTRRFKKLPSPARIAEDEKGKAREEQDGVVPSTEEYILHTTRMTIEVLQQAADFLPFPGARQALDLGLLLLTTYEDVNSLYGQAGGLNDRIAQLMLLMVDGIAGQDEQDVSPRVRQDIENLVQDFRIIQENLARITAQNKLLLVFFKEANKSKIDECAGRLDEVLQTFQLMRTIDASSMLTQIQAKLKSLHEDVKQTRRMVKDIHTWMNPKIAHGGDGNLGLEAMPTLPRLFGRDKIIAGIASDLASQRQPRIAVVGPGGMGKTAVSIAVMQDPQVEAVYREQNRFWVPCVGATSLFTFLQILRKALRITLDTGSLLKDIIDTLKATPEPRLLLLDNLETVMRLPEDVSEGGRFSAEIVLNQLSALPHVAILVTIRSNNLPSDTISWNLVPLEGLAREDAKAIYTSICPTASKHLAVLDLLVEALGYMPYAVTLLAKQAAKSFMTPDKLLEAWRKNGAKSLTGELRDKINNSIEFSINSRTVQDDPDAQKLLSIIGKLPSGTTFDHLEDWWGKDIENLPGAIATLSDTALITVRNQDTDTPTFHVLPVVQSYLRTHESYNSLNSRRLALKACCRFVLDHRSRPGDRNYKAHLQELDIEKNNILSILLGTTIETVSSTGEESDLPLVLDAIIAFGWYQLWTKRNPELLAHMLANIASEETATEPTILRRVAKGRYCLGRMKLLLGACSDASSHIEKARSISQRLGSPVDLVEAGKAALLLAHVWRLEGRGHEQVRDIIRAGEQDVGEDARGKALVLHHLGTYHLWIKEQEVGLDYAIRAKAAFDKLERKPAIEVFNCLMLISRSYGSLHSDPEWLDACTEALRYAKSIGLPTWIARALQDLAGCYIWKARYDDAIETLKEAVGMFEKVGKPDSLAHVMMLSGYVYMKMGDLVGARCAYEVAGKRLEEMEQTKATKARLEQCKNNVKVLSREVFDEAEFKVPSLLPKRG